MPTVQYNGDMYNDDRIFVLHIAKCTVATVDDHTTETTIYHENAPLEYTWCLVTYRNVERYLAVQVDHFDSPEEAQAYMERVEPTVPRISVGGQAPEQPLPYDEWVRWKRSNGLREYDYRSVFSSGGDNPREIVLSRRR